DVFTWFSGHRMRFFADKGLATPIDDVWNAVKSNYTAGFEASIKGNDGHAYAVPTDYYPWAVFYRKDVWAAKGYTVPTDWEAFKGLTWEQGADQLLRKQAGMYLLGLFVSDEFKASGSQADVDQLDFFAFPDVGSQYDAEKALDAPIDVYMVTKKSPTLSNDLGQ